MKLCWHQCPINIGFKEDIYTFYQASFNSTSQKLKRGDRATGDVILNFMGKKKSIYKIEKDEISLKMPCVICQWCP